MANALTLTASSLGRASQPSGAGAVLYVDGDNTVTIDAWPQPSRWIPDHVQLFRGDEEVAAPLPGDEWRWVLTGEIRFGMFRAVARAGEAVVESAPMVVHPVSVTVLAGAAEEVPGPHMRPSRAQATAPAGGALTGGAITRGAAAAGATDGSGGAATPAGAAASSGIATGSSAGQVRQGSPGGPHAGGTPTAPGAGGAQASRAAGSGGGLDGRSSSRAQATGWSTSGAPGLAASTGPTRSPGPTAGPAAASMQPGPTGPTGAQPAPATPPSTGPSGPQQWTPQPPGTPPWSQEPTPPSHPAANPAPEPQPPRAERLPAHASAADIAAVVEIPRGEYDGRFAALVGTLFTVLSAGVIWYAASRLLGDPDLFATSTPPAEAVPPDAPAPFVRPANVADRIGLGTSTMVLALGVVVILAGAALAALEVRARMLRRDRGGTAYSTGADPSAAGSAYHRGTSARGMPGALRHIAVILDRISQPRAVIAVLVTGGSLVLVGFFGQLHWALRL